MPRIQIDYADGRYRYRVKQDNDPGVPGVHYADIPTSTLAMWRAVEAADREVMDQLRKLDNLWFEAHDAQPDTAILTVREP